MENLDYKYLFQHTPIPLILTDKKGAILQTNESASLFLESIENGLKVTNILHLLYLSAKSTTFLDFHKNLGEQNEYAIKTKSGLSIYAQISCHHNPLENNGSYLFSFYLLKDHEQLIHDLNKQVKELKDYKYALNSGSIVSIAAADGTFTFVNENFCKISKYRSEELLGKHHSILWSGIHSPEYFQELKVALQDHKPYRGEFCNKSKDDTLYWVDAITVPFLDEEGNVYQYVSISHDITEQKEALEKLRASEERYKSIITVSNTGAWEYHLDTGRIWYSSHYFAMIGIDHPYGSWNDTLETSWIDMLHPDDRVRSVNVFDIFLKGGSMGLYENIFRMKHKNGNWVWIWSRGRRLRDANGNLTNITLGTHIDITEQKEASEKLRASEERYKSIIRVSNTGAWEYHLDTNRVWYSTQYFAMLGLDRPDGAWDETMATTWIERLHPDDRDRSIKTFDDFLKTGSMGFYENYFRMRHENGSWVSIWSRARRLRDKDGNLTDVTLGTHTDISERIKAEEEIRESEQRIKKITSMVPANTYMFEIDKNGITHTLFFNRGTDEINHSLDLQNPEEASQKLLKALYEDDKILWKEEMKNAFHSQLPISFQYRIWLNDQLRWRWFRAIPEKTSDGKIIWYGAAQDITPIVDYIASIEQIIFDISHVIRRPISSMIGITKLVIDNELSEEEIKEISKKMYLISEEMDRFIRELDFVYNQKKENTKLNIDISSLIDRRKSLFD